MEFLTLSLITAGLLIVIGLFAVLFLDNLVKKVMGAMFITDGVNLVLVSMGYRPDGIVPIVLSKIKGIVCEYPNLSNECIARFSSVAGYPLPYALVLTNIVIGAATTAVMLGLIIRLYNRYHSLSASKILGGESE